MKIVTLRDNTRIYKPLRDPITAVMGALSIYQSISGIFGGDNAGSYDVTGRFIPGDINSRLDFLSQWMSRYGLTPSDIEKEMVDSFIYQPAGWQGQVSSYVQQVAEDKRLNPGKYSGNIAPGPGAHYPDGSGASFSGFGGDISTLIMLGIGAGLLFNLMSKKKRK